MDLSYHIEELLFSNDCVIIPTIGGFIVNYASASIDFVEQQLLPPQKSVSFNPKLVNNDGLLANHIAQKEHLTYKQATLKVEEFSRQIEADLFNNKIVHFENIGKLYFNSDSKLEFVPANTNFLKEAYGLPSLSCTPVLRNKDYLTQQSIPEHLVPVKRKKKAVLLPLLAQRKVIAVAAVLIFVLSTPFIYHAVIGDASEADTTVLADNNSQNDKDSNNNAQASLIPSINNNTSTTTQEPVDVILVDTTAVVKETVEEVEVPTVDENAENYVIVLGAFGKKKNADRLAKKLEKDNYLPDVTFKNGLNRVGVQITCTPEELKLHLDFLQENYNKKAWVVE